MISCQAAHTLGLDKRPIVCCTIPIRICSAVHPPPLDNTGYGYTSEDYPGRVAVGRLVSDDDVRFITARDLYAISAYAQKVSPEALALWES